MATATARTKQLACKDCAATYEIVGACRSCNSSKHNLTLQEFVARRCAPSPA